MDRTIKTQTGFTLIEIIVVVAVVGIIMTIALHNFNRTSQAARETEDLEKISSFLQSKRLAAFTEKTELAINISASGNSLTAVKDPLGTPVTDGTISLSNTIQPASATFNINSRGLFSTTGSIRLANLTNVAANSCVAVNNTRIRLGAWDTVNAKCDAN